MPCLHCTPSDATLNRLPFTRTDWLASDSHEGVGFSRCLGCEDRWLNFWVEIFDDQWLYWSPMTPEDEARLRAEKDSYKVYEIARSIVRNHKVVCKGPVRGIEWVSGSHALLEGPPW